MALHHRMIGKAARLVWRVTKPRTIGVRAVLLDGAGRVALVRHTYTDLWYLAGGGVKKGAGIAAALFRELAEEANRLNETARIYVNLMAANVRRRLQNLTGTTGNAYAPGRGVAAYA